MNSCYRRMQCYDMPAKPAPGYCIIPNIPKMYHTLAPILYDRPQLFIPALVIVLWETSMGLGGNGNKIFPYK